MAGDVVQLHQMTLDQAVKYAVEAAEKSTLFFTKHALQRMREREITPVQVVRVIKQRNAVEGPYQDIKGRWKCRFEGYDAGDGIAVSLGYYIHKGIRVTVITTFELR